jgi:uncharacterized protein YggE
MTILALAAAMPAAAQQMTVLSPGETLLEVQASGEVRVVPDTALVTVGVVSTGTTAREATDANARTMTAVIAAVRKAGIAERDVRTQQIGVQPRFARNNGDDYEGQAQITGYVARNSVAVRVTRLATAPDVIAAAFGAGANSVNGPTLGTDDPDRGLREAREEALKNARAEAEAYAAGLGMRVARVIRVSERGNTVQPTGDIVVTARRMEAAPTRLPPISGGELQRSLTVWIDCALTAK